MIAVALALWPSDKRICPSHRPSSGSTRSLREEGAWPRSTRVMHPPQKRHPAALAQKRTYGALQRVLVVPKEGLNTGLVVLTMSFE